MNSSSGPERAKALAEYQILNTPSEQAYDDITEQASKLLNCPIALIVLLDEKRQWYKSKVGMEAAENPLDDAFCTHTILEEDMLVVPDATADARFAENPFVTSGPKIRFYAGVPLVNHNGVALGSLCVIDRKPQQITEEQAEVLRKLGQQVIELFERRRRGLPLSASTSIRR